MFKTHSCQLLLAKFQVKFTNFRRAGVDGYHDDHGLNRAAGLYEAHDHDDAPPNGLGNDEPVGQGYSARI